MYSGRGDRRGESHRSVDRPCAASQGATPFADTGSSPAYGGGAHAPRWCVRGAGGTPGGLPSFRAGAAMLVVGGYLLLARVTVTSGYWALWSYNAFGLSLVPLLIGIGVLFFNGRSALGWALTAIGTLIILAGIVANLHLYFQPTSLFDTLLMLGLLAAGLGLIARSLRPQGPGTARDDSWAS